jgi:hypothetical protein
MTDRKPRGSLQPGVGTGLGLLIASLIGWLWSGDWRFAVTGVALLIIGAIVDAVRDGRKERLSGSRSDHRSRPVGGSD